MINVGITGASGRMGRALLEAVTNAEGMTVFLVEQNTAQLRGFIERVYQLEEGQVVNEGAIQELTKMDEGAHRSRPSSARRTGAKDRRCSGHGPFFVSAVTCAAVG